MLRIVIAFAAAIFIVGTITVPIMVYLDSLEMQGKFSTTDWPKWIAQLLAFSLIAITISLAKILLILMQRRWPKDPVDEQEEQKPHWLKTPPKE